MVIKSIDPYRCTGCGECAHECPGDVIRMLNNKATITYPEDCFDCCLCEMTCPAYAIEMAMRKELRSMGRVFPVDTIDKRRVTKREGAIVKCKKCETVYENYSILAICPKCGSDQYESVKELKE